MGNDAAIDPSKLIDLELVNLLRYCHELQAHKETEDYQDEIMLKSLQLGTKTKDRKGTVHIRKGKPVRERRSPICKPRKREHEKET